jgi:hypothetical protein
VRRSTSTKLNLKLIKPKFKRRARYGRARGNALRAPRARRGAGRALDAAREARAAAGEGAGPRGWGGPPPRGGGPGGGGGAPRGVRGATREARGRRRARTREGRVRALGAAGARREGEEDGKGEKEEETRLTLGSKIRR